MKKHLVYAAVPAIAIAAVAGVALATPNPLGDRQNAMANVIAERFNLNAADVQAVFAEHRQAMKVAHDEKAAERLNALVAAGKLTQQQANLITAKRAELEAQRESLKVSLEGKTREEIHVAIKAHMDSLKSWAEANGIPLQYLMMGKSHGIRGPMR